MNLLSYLKTLIRLKLKLVMIVCIALALVLSGARLLMYSLPVQKETVERWLSTDSYQLSIGELQGDWHHFRPMLSARNIRVQNPDGEYLVQLDSAKLELDLIRSLLQQRAIFRYALLDKLTLKLVRNGSGDWQLYGMDGDTDTEPSVDLAEMLADLLRHRKVRLVNMGVAVELENGESYPQQLINASLDREGGRYNFQAKIADSRSEGSEKSLELIALGKGLPGSDKFQARFYINIPQQNKGVWLPLIPAQFVAPIEKSLVQQDATLSTALSDDRESIPLAQLQTLEFSSQLWGEWQGAMLRRLSGTLQIPKLAWQSSPKSATAGKNGQALSAQKQQLTNFQTRLLLQSDGPQQWLFQLSGLHGEINQKTLPFQELQGLWGKHQDLQLSLNQLDLESSTALLLASSVVPEAVKEELSVLTPKGLLKNLSINVGGIRQDLPLAFELQADLDKVGVSAWSGAPELRGVKGLLRVDQNGGSVDFDSPLKMNFPELYQQGWALDRARGRVSWQLRSDAVEVESQRLQIWQEGVEANGRFSLDLPFSEDEQSNFTLLIGMDNSDGSKAPLFVPDKIVDKGLFDWLSQSIQAGHLNSGGFFYQGPLEDWAPDPSLQMFFDVSQGVIKYQPDWPQVTHSESYTLIKNSEVLVSINSGQIYNTQITSGEVYLPPDSQKLQVKAHLAGPAADGRKVLLEAPTKQYLGEEFAQWQLSGKAKTRLDLAIDLEDADRSRIRVLTDLSDATYASSGLDLSFDQLSGRISYHESDGLSSGPIKGRFMEQPIAARINTTEDAKGLHTLIEATGPVNIRRFNRWLKQPVLDFFDGSAEVFANLDICTASTDCTRLKVSSSLEGVASQHLPEPFAKTADQRVPLAVSANLTGEQQWLTIKYGREFQSLLALVEDGISGGELVLGAGQSAPRARKHGLWIRGSMARIDAKSWQRFLDRLFPEAVAEGGRPQINPLLKAVDLYTDNLVFDAAFGEQSNAVASIGAGLSIKLEPSSEGWRLRVASPVLLGTVLLPTQTQKPIKADFEYIRLPDFDDQENNDNQDVGPIAEQQTTAQKPDFLADFDPSQLPLMQLSVNELKIGEEDYGRWALAVEPVENGVQITGIEGLVKEVTTKADMRWLDTVDGQQTYIDLSLAAAQLGDVQEAWGTEKTLESKDARVAGKLRWSGSPLNFNFHSLYGDLELSAGQGLFLDTTGSGGALKLFGLLNFNALGRRLRLDFSDLSSKGVSFDEISAAYRIDQGIASNVQPLSLTGPTVDIRLEGSFDLLNKTLDQRMDITVPLAENLPLTAVLLSTPQVAGALFLVEKLVGKQLRKFTTARYTISGDWEEPEIEPVVSKKPSESGSSSER
ncbi:YhdP family protein [Motiliproteus sp. MSK22-1]|uniref:YhdP family protein n=1 Tax=Motiliproteus sp. MSK22-1 TaxID=1897630 RepID=UPI0009772EA7|nr:YhdP family protein [Motiliproteus sp. MSK22-1]OMH30372.1 TIGR02099 family protein [Motiliproteus sp. MSK22-1]